MKTYKIISSICALLVILGAVTQFFHTSIGIPNGTVTLLALLVWVLYQTWHISKLHKRLKNKEQSKISFHQL